MAISSIDTTRVLAAAVAVIAVKVGWELLFSPLKAFPGPLLAKFTDLWRAVLTKLGNVDPKYKQWHKTWGSAVRVGPNAISLSDPDLIKVIYTTKNPWRKVRTGSGATLSASLCAATNLYVNHRVTCTDPTMSSSTANESPTSSTRKTMPSIASTRDRSAVSGP